MVRRSSNPNKSKRRTRQYLHQFTPMLLDKYRQRDIDLLSLGFPSYAAYLNSPLWGDIRQDVLDRAEGVCEVCVSNAAKQVHHRSYDVRVLLGKVLSMLTAVCDRCHREAELTPAGDKRFLQEANAHMEARAWIDGRVLPGVCRSCRKNSTGDRSSRCGKCARGGTIPGSLLEE